jgi:GAF domain-containing protein
MLAASTTRNYPALFLALDEVLEAVHDGSPDEAALQRSFEGSADGFGAAKAVLLLVGDDGLRAVASRGLAAAEVAACEKWESSPGVSSSTIREAILERRPVLVQDAENLRGRLATSALRGRPFSVLCAPVCHPRTGAVLAVLYVQTYGVRDAFGEIDRAWIEVYARTLGRAMAGRR